MAGEEAVEGPRARAGGRQMEIHSGNEKESEQEAPQRKAGGPIKRRRRAEDNRSGRGDGVRAADVIENFKSSITEGKMLLRALKATPLECFTKSKRFIWAAI